MSGAGFVCTFTITLLGIGTLHADLMDTITLGDSASEAAHAFHSSNSEVITGGLGQSARHLLPPVTPGWAGGEMSVTLTIDPEKPNYLTTRFWGDEVTGNRMLLFADEKQIGYRHLGDIDQVDFGNEDPVYNGRFYYVTTPLPLSLTQGKKSMRFELRGYGPIWPYGMTFDSFQKPMTTPTRGTYRLYTHTEGCFVPPEDEKQGMAVASPPVRPAPGPEILDQVKARINGEIAKELAASIPPNQMQIELLSRAWSVDWSIAYHNPAVLDKVLSGLDALAQAYFKNPSLAQSDPVTPNPDWFGLGLAGQAITMLSGPLKPHLEEQIDIAGADGGQGEGEGRMTRRAAYTKMLVTSRDWHRQHRRLYTNQSMINDLYGIYLCNRGVAALAPEEALPEPEVRRYLYESVGLQRWSDSDPGDPSVKGPQERTTKNWNVGENYWELTEKGLTKELGFVGNYGEVIDWVTAIYEATRPVPWQTGSSGDTKILAQLIKIAKARSIFRYPMQDAQGNRAMRLETVIGWRDAHIPGDIVYAQRASWDANTLEAAASTLDPALIGFGSQMLDDNQYFASLARQMEQPGLRSTIGLLSAPNDYKAVLGYTGKRRGLLPMAPGQPDFVWTDEEDGVVAVKHGEEIFYASLYWRARQAINFLARVHDLTPQFSRIAVVAEQTVYTSSGITFRRPNWTTAGYGNGGVPYKEVSVSASTGEKLPVARMPRGVNYKMGDENVYAGKGDFYTLRYGPFLIGMNMTKEKKFQLTVPVGMDDAVDLVSGKKYKAGAEIDVNPRSTVVLREKGKMKNEE